MQYKNWTIQFGKEGDMLTYTAYRNSKESEKHLRYSLVACFALIDGEEDQ